MSAARKAILDAAEGCLRREGIRRTTVAAVAAEAGFSRAYLYRFFPDKATLVAAALIRRDEQFWDEARERVGAVMHRDGVAGMVAEAVLLSSRSPLGPLALELAESEPEAFAEVVGTYVHEVVPGLAGFWVDMLTVAQRAGVVRDDLDVGTGAEWVLRVVHSLVAVPGERVDTGDRAAVVDFLRTYLAPAFEPAHQET